MKLKRIKIITVISSLILFVISLTQNAVITNFKGIRPQPALDYFLMGSTAIAGGGFLEWIIWLANPICLFAIINLLKDKEKALIKCIIALILAISFSFWNNILGSESGSNATIVSFELGYYLWLISILILTLGTFYYFSKTKKTTNK